jgi:hypothetical protein
VLSIRLGPSCRLTVWRKAPPLLDDRPRLTRRFDAICDPLPW